MDSIRTYRLDGQMTFAQAIDDVDACLRRGLQDGARAVLVDVRAVHGFDSPDLAARTAMVRRWAATAAGRLKFALVCRPEWIDGERFGVVLARSMALDGDVFADELEARRWLASIPAG